MRRIVCSIRSRGTRGLIVISVICERGETEKIPFPLRKINDVLSGMDVFAARCRIAEMQGEAKSDVAWPIARVSVDRWG